MPLVAEERSNSAESVAAGRGGAAIGRITVWSRTPGEYAVVLRPLAALQAARQEPELYREMLMNVALFLPLGLALSQVLPQKWPCWERVLLTIFVSGALSAAVEYTQYHFALGMAETDDVFCNALGALDGALSLSIGQWMKRCGRSRQSVQTRKINENESRPWSIFHSRLFFSID